jgi:type VI secretion system protein ImpH
MKHSAPENHPPLVENMLAAPGGFAFPQVVEIATRYLQSRGETVLPDTFRYSVNPALSFPPRDIESLEFVFREEHPPQVALTLNLMGLHGAGSPLPAYFTEYVAQHADEEDPLRDFLDIFNHRLIGLLHETWRKYRYYAQYRAQATDLLSNRFFGFIGAGHKDIRGARELKWPRLMAYMGLIAFNGESAGSLENILRHYFSHKDIKIIPFIRRWVAVPADQQTRLGERSCCLGEDFITGEEVPDQTGKFRIRISNLTWAGFNAFLPSGTNFSELQTLVKFILRSRLDFDVELRLLPEELKPWLLDGANECFLGWSTWAGDGGDGIVILDIDHQEL